MNNNFYDEFINNKNKISEYEDDSRLKVESFLEYFVNKYPLNYENVKMLSTGLQNYINKPQRVLCNNKNNYVAIDMYTNLYYICFKDLVVFDIDLENNNLFFKNMKKKYLINKFKNYDDIFYLDETKNGFHIFLLNKRYHHTSKEAIEYMIEFGCDIKYIVCTYLRGFCIRLNKKNINDNMYIHCGIYNNSLNLYSDMIEIDSSSDSESEPEIVRINKEILNDINYFKLLVDKYKNIIVY